jgi:hypothetical protein
MFVGKAEDGIFDSSVLRVDTDTGETVALDTTTDLVFHLAYDARRGRLFSVGIKRPPEGGISTVIEIFEGAAFQRNRVILEIPGEYLDATVIVDAVTGTAYTTLDDRGGILTWDGTRVSELLRNPAHIPARIFLEGTYLYSVNRDGTVSVIDRSTGEQVLDLYVIDGVGSGAWLAVRPDGRFFASRGSLATTRYLSLSGATEQSASEILERLRLRVPEEANVPSPSGDQRAPGDRFDSGRDPDRDEPGRDFDPFDDAPAPSS